MKETCFVTILFHYSKQQFTEVDWYFNFDGVKKMQNIAQKLIIAKWLYRIQSVSISQNGRICINRTHAAYWIMIYISFDRLSDHISMQTQSPGSVHGIRVSHFALISMFQS